VKWVPGRHPVSRPALGSLAVILTLAAVAACSSAGVSQATPASQIMAAWATRHDALATGVVGAITPIETDVALRQDVFRVGTYCKGLRGGCPPLEPSKPRDVRVLGSSPTDKLPRFAAVTFLDSAESVPAEGRYIVIAEQDTPSGPWKLAVDVIDIDKGALTASGKMTVQSAASDGIVGLAKYWAAVTQGQEPPDRPRFEAGRFTTSFSKLLGTHPQTQADRTVSTTYTAEPKSYTLQANGITVECGAIRELSESSATNAGEGFPSSDLGDVSGDLVPGRYLKAQIEQETAVCILANPPGTLAVSFRTGGYVAVTGSRLR